MISEEDISILQPQEAKLVRDSIKQLLQNQDDGIVSDIEQVETTLDFKFSRDVIRFILHENMSDIQWIPTGMFAQHDFNSPFTPQFKAAIKAELNENEYKFRELYDRHFPDKSKVVEIHKEKCNLFINDFISETFSPELFIKCCTFLGFSAGISYQYGSHFAPYQSFLAIIRCVKIIKYLKELSYNFWNLIQGWLECREYELKRLTRHTFPNEYFRHDRMGINAENAVETTFELKFGRDLIRFILHEYLTHLYWFPTGIFAENDLDSPFTPQLKKALRELLDSYLQNFQTVYDKFFPDKSKAPEIHLENCMAFKDSFVNGIFSPNIFIVFCALLGISAGLSYFYGARLAPYQSLQALLTAVKELKYLGKVGDNLWNEVYNWVDRHEKGLKMEILQNGLTISDVMNLKHIFLT